jgi:hypothetical protein
MNVAPRWSWAISMNSLGWWAWSMEPRAADDGGEARLLELAGLGGEGHHAGRAVVAGHAAGEGFGGAVALGHERGHVGAHLDRHAAIGEPRLQRPIHRLGLGEEGCDDLLRRPRARRADVEHELAFAGDDVVGRAATHHADGECRTLRRERRRRIGLVLKPGRKRIQRAHQRHRLHHRRHAQVRLAGMAFAAGDGDLEGGDALVAVHGLHVGGLAHNHHRRRRQLAADDVDHEGRAQAADLFVVREGQVHRLLRGLGEFRRRGQGQGQEGLHVAGPAAVEAAVVLGQGPGIGGPGLAIDRNHVGVARQHDAAFDSRPDGGHQVRLRAVGVGHAAVGDRQGVEIALDPLHELEV